MYEYAMVANLCIGQYQASVVRIEDGVLLLARRIDVRLFPLDLRRLMINLTMHLRQKLRRRCSEPPPATKLERPKMAAPVRRTQDRIRVLLELFEGDSRLGRDLEDTLVHRSKQ
jgi:hypothetical protein